MINKIETTEDVKAFAKQLITEGVSFHPDDDFNDYINFEKGEPIYTREEADLRNDLMNKCFQVCEKAGKDIYDMMLKVSLKETGMDTLIPIPSQFNLSDN